jgi:hypothetical protein
VLAVVLSLLALLVARSALACLWDDDTAAMEARGMPEVGEVIVGRFERNPPLYYEMRLSRAEARSREDARALEAYDNAGVACDRLGRGDDAIAWMARKKAALDGLPRDAPATTEHLYRYLANLGTFHAHRWVRKGARRDDLEDLRRSRELIRAAIELNPNAHFGRERYQLLAIEAMLRDPPAPDPTAFATGTFLEQPGWTEREHALFLHFGAIRPNDTLQKLGYGDAIQGLAGLVALGSAWESVDVFYALALVLQLDGRSSLSYLAMRRVEELVAAGQQSLVPSGPGRDRPRGAEGYLDEPLKPEVVARLDRYFAEARASADRWHAQRETFMTERLRAGRHPDTDAGFWKGFEGERAPQLPGEAPGEWVASHPILVTSIAGLATIVLIIGAHRWRVRRLIVRALSEP